MNHFIDAENLLPGRILDFIEFPISILFFSFSFDELIMMLIKKFVILFLC